MASTSNVLTVETPVVTIFVRHSADCPHVGDESWKRCNCSKHLRWTYGGKQYRQSAKSRNWAGAEEQKRRIEAQFSGGRGSETKVEVNAPKTLELAAKAFIEMKRSQGVSGPILKKYERELKRLSDFFSNRGKMFPRDITLDGLIEFRALWEKAYPSPTTRQKVQERLRGFLSYCYEAGHTDRVPKLSPIQGKPSPTMPLTAAEYDALLKAVPKSFEDSVRTKRVRALIQLMRHSGLAIRDAVTLERGEIQHDKKKDIHRIVTARQKTGTHVSVPIPRDVAEEVLAVLNGNPKYVFWTGTSKEESAVTNWQHDLRKVFREAGFPKGHPHQLRDTFAVDMLVKGLPLQEVSKLLGHESIKTTEKYYAKWVPERQDRLDSLVVATWDQK